MTPSDDAPANQGQKSPDVGMLALCGALMLVTASLAATVEISSSENDRLIGVLARAYAVCAGVGSLLLTSRRSRGPGVALGFGAALFFVPLAGLLLVVIALFGGLASNEGAIWALLTALATLALVATWFGARHFADGPSWLVGLLAPPMTIAVLLAITAPRIVPLPYQVVQRNASYQSLQASLDGTWRCLGAFHESENRYPSTFDELRADCEPARSWPGPVEYFAARPGIDGTVQAYSLCGTVPSPIPGEFVAARATVRGSRSDPTGYSQSRACGAGEMGGILHCAFAFEASQPDRRGFPSSLRDLGPSGTDCLAIGQSLGKWSLDTGGYRYTYLPGPPGTDGRIGSFVIVGWPSVSDQIFHLPSQFVDETGVVRFTMEGRLAGPTDPVSGAADSPAERVEQRPLDRLVPACGDGEALACHLLGSELRRLDALYRRDRQDYSRGGASGGPASFKGLASSQAVLDRACAGGSGVACREWGRSLELIKAEPAGVLAAYQRGCALRDAAACYEVAQMALEDASLGNDRDAVQALERSCDAGVVEGCVSFSKILREGQAVAKDVARAERLLRYACAGINVGCTNYR